MGVVRSRVAVGVASSALLISACGSGSSGESPTSSIVDPADPTATTSAAEIAVFSESDDSQSVAVAGDAENDADGEAPPSLPANIWPEEIVDTSEIPDSDAEQDVEPDDKGIVTRSADADGDGIQPEGVGSVTVRVTSADGDTCEVCLWLADDDVSRQRGLMEVTDLGDAVGMAFLWEQPRTGNFVMFQTPTPLSIAWFDESGTHVGEADMEPCLDETSTRCERYTADSPYVLAIEMFGGQLDAVGIGPGSSVELLDLSCA